MGFLRQWERTIQQPSRHRGRCRGIVYVADTGNSRIQKFTSTGALIAQWNSAGLFGETLDGPCGVATDAFGNVFVADTYNSRIVKFTTDGIYLTRWGTSGSARKGGLQQPHGIATDAAGRVYLANTNDHQILAFSGSGTLLAFWGLHGTPPYSPYDIGPYYNAPFGVTACTDGTFYIADTINDCIQHFYSHSYSAVVGELGGGSGQFREPEGVTTDAAGNLYVADTGNDRIQEFSSAGAFITMWGSSGSGPGQFSSPSGVATDGAGNVYVADTGNHRIQKFGPGPTAVIPTTWGRLKRLYR